MGDITREKAVVTSRLYERSVATIMVQKKTIDHITAEMLFCPLTQVRCGSPI
jgi:hypothetical protein